MSGENIYNNISHVLLKLSKIKPGVSSNDNRDACIDFEEFMGQLHKFIETTSNAKLEALSVVSFRTEGAVEGLKTALEKCCKGHGTVEQCNNKLRAALHWLTRLRLVLLTQHINEQATDKAQNEAKNKVLQTANELLQAATPTQTARRVLVEDLLKNLNNWVHLATLYDDPSMLYSKSMTYGSFIYDAAVDAIDNLKFAIKENDYTNTNDITNALISEINEADETTPPANRVEKRRGHRSVLNAMGVLEKNIWNFESNINNFNIKSVQDAYKNVLKAINDNLRVKQAERWKKEIHAEMERLNENKDNPSNKTRESVAMALGVMVTELLNDNDSGVEGFSTPNVWKLQNPLNESLDSNTSDHTTPVTPNSTSGGRHLQRWASLSPSVSTDSGAEI